MVKDGFKCGSCDNRVKVEGEHCQSCEDRAEKVAEEACRLAELEAKAKLWDHYRGKLIDNHLIDSQDEVFGKYKCILCPRSVKKEDDICDKCMAKSMKLVDLVNKLIPDAPISLPSSSSSSNKDTKEIPISRIIFEIDFEKEINNKNDGDYLVLMGEHLMTMIACNANSWLKAGNTTQVIIFTMKNEPKNRKMFACKGRWSCEDVRYSFICKKIHQLKGVKMIKFATFDIPELIPNYERIVKQADESNAETLYSM